MRKPKETPTERLQRVHYLINEAIRKGFKVFKDNGLWWIERPSRPRRPGAILGSYVTDDRAWMSAAFLAQNFPEAKTAARKATKR